MAAGRAEAVHTLDTMNHFFLLNQIITVGSNDWNVLTDKVIGEVVDDQEGMKNIQQLGKNMAWLLKKIKT